MPTTYGLQQLPGPLAGERPDPPGWFQNLNLRISRSDPVTTWTALPATGDYDGQMIAVQDIDAVAQWTGPGGRWIPTSVVTVPTTTYRGQMFPSPQNGDRVRVAGDLWARRYSTITSSWRPDLLGDIPVLPTGVAGSGVTLAADGTINLATSAGTTVSVNGCFTSDFEDYTIQFGFDSAGTSADVAFRLRNAGSDNSSNTQQYAGTDTTPTTGPTRFGLSPTTQLLVGRVSTAGGRGTVEVLRPSVAKNKFVTFRGFDADSVARIGGGSIAQTTAHDGFSLPSAPALVGWIRVYGKGY